MPFSAAPLRRKASNTGRFMAAASLAVLMAACNVTGSVGASPAEPGDPVETRPANGANQRPAYAGQTRASGVHP